MFKIFIKNLKLYGYHGVNPEEKKEGQYFIFNIEIFVTSESFKGCDDLGQTVNYSLAVETVKEINRSKKFDLLETLAEEITFKIAYLSPIISEVITRVEKITPPIKEDLESVGVEFRLEAKTGKPSGSREGSFNGDAFQGLPESEENHAGENEIAGDAYEKVYISIGTNKGNRLENIKKALAELGKCCFLKIISTSSVYETEPMYLKEQDNFYNIAVKAILEMPVNPFVLLGHIKSIEHEMGRENQDVKNGPRIIDIDIISIDNIKIDSDILKLPHPGLPERNFVLVPLSEIEPAYEVGKMAIGEFIKSRNFPEKVSRIMEGI